MKVKKSIFIIFLLLGFLVVVYFLLTRIFHIDEKAVITSLKPPAKDIKQNLPQGSDVNFPLSIPEGFRIAVFADLKDIGAPRVLTFDPNGVLLASIPGSSKVVALPDKNSDGVVDEIVEVAVSLSRPHGIAFQGNKIFIAETDKVVAYDYDGQSLKAKNPKTLFSLPGGGRHFTRTIKILEDKLYTSIGSSCDVCLENDWRRSAILVSNLDGSNLKVYAKGLRNTVFFTFDENGKMWGNDMGRDFLGDNLPPDELNIIGSGEDYGWPWCYGDRVRDSKFRGNENRDYCFATEASSLDYPAHVAPLGLALIDSSLFSKEDQGDILVSFHGSWNSSAPVGYKIVKLDVQGSKVIKMQDFITGWLSSRNEVLGRPVDLIFAKNGVLYISDDKANLVYILTK